MELCIKKKSGQIKLPKKISIIAALNKNFDIISEHSHHYNTSNTRNLKKCDISDSDSEDSFIVFEDSDDCNDQDIISDKSDSCNEHTDDDADTDDETCEDQVTFTRSCYDLPHSVRVLNHQRVLGNEPVSESQNSIDEVDCAVLNMGAEIPYTDLINNDLSDDRFSGKYSELLAVDKLESKTSPKKSVRFSPKPAKVHIMRVWSFAAQQARCGPWEQHARDRDRFLRRIADIDTAISWVLKPKHRSKVMLQRYIETDEDAADRKITENKLKSKEEDGKTVEDNKMKDDFDYEVITENCINEILDSFAENLDNALIEQDC